MFQNFWNTHSTYLSRSIGEEMKEKWNIYLSIRFRVRGGKNVRFFRIFFPIIRRDEGEIGKMIGEIFLWKSVALQRLPNERLADNVEIGGYWSGIENKFICGFK